MPKKPNNDVLNNAVETDTEPSVVVPSRDSKEWTDFVLSHLESSEIFEGKPKTRALRRLVLKFCGDIIYSDTQFVDSELNIGGLQGLRKVVCKHTIRFVEHGTNIVKEHSALGDAAPFNLSADFVKFTTVTAETRSKGRCYVEALGLDIVTSDEMNSEAAIDVLEGASNNSFIQEHQLNAIDKQCQKLDINVKKLFQEFQQQGMQFEKISLVGYSDAILILAKLNDYNRKVSDIPENLLGYVQNWRNK